MSKVVEACRNARSKVAEMSPAQKRLMASELKKRLRQMKIDTAELERTIETMGGSTMN